jgi:hypothetical protein
MDNNTLKNIFKFLKNKEGKKHRQQDTLLWKLIFNEPLTMKTIICLMLALAILLVQLFVK